MSEQRGDLRPGDVPTFVINLDRRPDRLERVATRLDRAGIAFARHAAVTPDGFRGSGIRSANPGLQPTELACVASHFEIYRRVADEQIPMALILEDDVLPVANFGRRVRRALDRVPARASLVQLGWVDLTPVRARPPRSLGRSALANVAPRANVLEPEPFRLGTHAYCVTPAFARVALQTLDPVFAALDEMLRQLTSEPTLAGSCFVHRPSLALQDTSPSDIRQFRPVSGYRSWRRLLP
jgi:GR25 family glycosyltransferase involved in LPS biosynthesis